MIMSCPAASVMFSSFFTFHVHSLYYFLLFASPSISRSPLPANVCFPPSWFYTPPYCVKPISNYPHHPCVFSLCASCSLCQFIFVPTVKRTSIYSDWFWSIVLFWVICLFWLPACLLSIKRHSDFYCLVLSRASKCSILCITSCNL